MATGRAMTTTEAPLARAPAAVIAMDRALVPDAWTWTCAAIAQAAAMPVAAPKRPYGARRFGPRAAVDYGDAD